jgi:hypothetical protein
MVEEPSHVNLLSLNHVCKIGLKLHNEIMNFFQEEDIEKLNDAFSSLKTRSICKETTDKVKTF